MQPSELVATPRNPVPFGAQVGLLSDGGHPPLRVAIWRHEAPRGTVFVLQGRAEFIEKYFETVSDLQRRGFAVVAFDWRGQGGSGRLLEDPRKGHVGTFSEYHDDLRHLLAERAIATLPQPYFALAHSMGGDIALQIAARDASPFSTVVLSAPLIEIHRVRLGMAETVAYRLAQSAVATGFGSRFVPGGGAPSLESLAFEGNPLTRDPVRFARNKEVAEVAPELMIGDPTLGWLAAAFASMRELNRPGEADRIGVPVVCFAAERDSIVSSPAIERYCDGLKLCSCIMLRDAEHELLQERDAIRDHFWAVFDAYFAEKVAVRA